MMGVTVLFSVAAKSLRYRLSGVILTTIAVALSVFVLLGVEHVRQESRSSFASTVSGVDLIVGARTGDINLLLFSVFRIGSASANVSWESVEAINEHPQVDWVVPLSLGDSHRGYRVVGTTEGFFDRYHYGRKQQITFDTGSQFSETADVVLGAAVAKSLGYGIGDSLILSHGVADTSFVHHDQVPFTVVGLLSPTGTPVDNALFVSLEAIDAMHADEETAQEHGHDERESHDDHNGHDEHDEHDEYGEHHAHDHSGPLGSVSAVLVGLDGPFATLQVQRWINEFEDEALLGILPGVTLTQLWDIMARIEDTLRGIAILVFISSLFGLNAMLLASMRERRQEIGILRSIGAPSLFILGMLVAESLLIVIVGIVLAIGCLIVAIGAVNGFLMSEVGISFSYQILYPTSLIALTLIVIVSVFMSLLPAWQAYRLSTSPGASSSQSTTFETRSLRDASS
ncbi:MAG: FtsX-like permease family protein [Pseudomonadota bacterium]|nr:FtsX-like permease family protein [Pseudomonadota bacterium]